MIADSQHARAYTVAELIRQVDADTAASERERALADVAETARGASEELDTLQSKLDDAYATAENALKALDRLADEINDDLSASQQAKLDRYLKRLRKALDAYGDIRVDCLI